MLATSHNIKVRGILNTSREYFNKKKKLFREDTPMNAAEVLDNGHLMIIQAVDNLPELEWDIPNACGV